MKIRSMLFVPGDSRRKFDKARQSGADALILDLEDSVAIQNKPAAREATVSMLGEDRSNQRYFVRINSLDSAFSLLDLAAVMPARPDGIVLPKSESGDDVRRLGFYLDALEAANGQDPGHTRILAIATETARSISGLASYRGCSNRLWGMLWGGEDLSADLGAYGNRQDGRYTGPYQLARDLCLLNARAAGVEPIDAVFTDIKDLESLGREAATAARDGFTGKAVIHPAHVEVVNAAFSPGLEEIDWARRILKAFEDAPESGVIKIDGQMIDKPHLVQAQRILARAER